MATKRSGAFAASRPQVVDKKYDDSKNKYVGLAKSAKRKNKINLKAVGEILAERGYDPTHEIINIMETGSLPKEVEVRVWTTLLEYTQAKKKAVEITGKDGGPIRMESVSDADLLKIAMGGPVIDAEDVPYNEVVDERPRNAFGQLITQEIIEQAVQVATEDDAQEGDSAWEK